ncbi:MAG: hypothetical protein LAP87_31130, partial [Acidobacteriia bacterium]|nr:hypothetical protein [Terriglobia bacterium]
GDPGHIFNPGPSGPVKDPLPAEVLFTGLGTGARTAWLDDAKPYLAKGPSGVSVRTLVRLAMEWK